MAVAFIAFPPDVIARTSGISGLGNYCVGKDIKLRLWRTRLRLQQESQSADADIGIDDVFEQRARDVSEHPCPHHVAYHHAHDAVDISHCHGCGEESVVCPRHGHHQVANEEVGLRLGEIMVLVGFGIHEIQHRRRSLHAEESAHQSAQSAGCDLQRLGRLYLYALAEKGEVYAHDDKRDAEQDVQYAVFHAFEHEYGTCRHRHEGNQYGQQSAPYDVFVFL